MSVWNKDKSAETIPSMETSRCHEPISCARTFALVRVSSELHGASMVSERHQILSYNKKNKVHNLLIKR